MISDLRGIFFYGELEDNWIGHQMVDIYHDQIYRPLLPLLKEHTTALDIGGNIGLVSMYLSHYFEKVITLEPSSEHFDAFNRNLQINNITNVTPINKALYIKNGKFPFGGPIKNKTMRSLHMATWPEGKQEEVVDAITLDTLFEEQKIDHVDLLKLDIEGSEFEVLAHSSFKKVAPKIDVIIGEFHKWAGRHPNQIREALELNGFKMSGLPHDSEIFIGKRI